MRIRVKLFASYQELVGEPEVPLEIETGSTVADALEKVRREHPALAGQSHDPLTACNLRHVNGDHVLSDGDELALLPPVSGG